MSKQEYSEAVRDVVRSVGTGSIMLSSLPRHMLNGDGVNDAITQGLLLLKFPVTGEYALSVKGRDLFSEMGRENRRAIDREIRRRKEEAGASIEYDATLTNYEELYNYDCPDGVRYAGWEMTLLLDKRPAISKGARYKLTVIPPKPEPESEPERIYPMGKQQPAQIDCRREYCRYHMYGRCTNPAPAITLNGPPSMTNEKGVCWSYKDREPRQEPEPAAVEESMRDCYRGGTATIQHDLVAHTVSCSRDDGSRQTHDCADWADHSLLCLACFAPKPTPDPPCPVCGKAASEHKDGLFCCPRCGGVMRTFEWACGWWSACDGCSTHGPTRHELADAIEAGNRRA